MVFRKDIADDHVHPPRLAGIYGRKEDGARSVVLAGEYADEDHGEHLYAVSRPRATLYNSVCSPLSVAFISEVVEEHDMYVPSARTPYLR